MEQKIIGPEGDYRALDSWIKDNAGSGSVMLVCDSSLNFIAGISRHLAKLERNGIKILRFSRFVSNPLYDSVAEGTELFRKEACKAIIAIGGGSAIDVAKCIKLYCNMQPGTDYLAQKIVPNEVPFLAMPTTAGTGSEATRYAVIYRDGSKQSIAHESCIPGTVLFDSSALSTLPEYQRKSTMMDAFCHAMESFWSVNSNDESFLYSRKAMQGIMENMDSYLANLPDGNTGMLMAANMAGRAINITQTTGGHAMCYKLTSMYGIAHGHAAILCDRALFPWMAENADSSGLCSDYRGIAQVKRAFEAIANSMGCKSVSEAADKCESIFRMLGLAVPEASEKDIAELAGSVNPVRMKNHPMRLDRNTIEILYRRILKSS